MPDVGEAEYLVTLLYEAGLVSQAGMGVAPLPWSEIESWLNVTQLKLTPWESTTLRQMSEAYAAEYSVSSDVNRPAPYQHVVEEIEEIDRGTVAQKIRSVFNELRKK